MADRQERTGAGRDWEDSESAWLGSGERRSVSRARTYIVLGLVVIAAVGTVSWLMYDSAVSRELDRAKIDHEEALAEVEASQRALAAASSGLSSAQQDLQSETAGLSPSSSVVEALQSEIVRRQQALDAETAVERESERVRVDARSSEAEAQARVNDRWTYLLALLVGFVVCGISAVALYRLYSAEQRRRHDNRMLLDSAQPISDEDDDPFSYASRWDTNRNRLNSYHSLVSNYAESSRSLTMATLIGGLVFLAILTLVAVTVDNSASTVAVALVGVSGAGLAGIVVRSVLQNAEASSSELREFFLHPVDVERFLVAERIVDSMEGTDQSAARLAIVKGLTRRS